MAQKSMADEKRIIKERCTMTKCHGYISSQEKLTASRTLGGQIIDAAKLVGKFIEELVEILSLLKLFENTVPTHLIGKLLPITVLQPKLSKQKFTGSKN
jgi:hypothetical protein